MKKPAKKAMGGMMPMKPKKPVAMTGMMAPKGKAMPFKKGGSAKGMKGC